MEVVDSIESKIKEMAKSISSYPAITILIVLAILIGSIILIFYWMFKNVCLSTDGFLLRIFTYLSTPAGSEDCNASIGTLIERLGYIAGGLIALSVALATFQRAKAADKTAEAQIEATKAQNKTVAEQEKGNFQERYKNTFAQLNNEESSIRIAGFYGLYRLAQDDDKYNRTICDILCAYVRERTNSVITVKVPNINKAENRRYKEEYPEGPDNEIQSIINLLTKEKEGEKKPFQSEWVDLSRAYLVGANFTASILNGANLQQAQLQGADLSSAQLQGTILSKAQLQRAELFSAQIQRANLQKAQLQGANLQQAQLQGAVLSKAELQGADLKKAQLQGANLSSAQLQGAVLSKAELQESDLSFAQLQEANLSLAQLQGANLQQAQMQGANLFSAQLQGSVLHLVQMQGANLSDAQLQGANLSDAQLQGANLNEINLVGAISSETYSYTNATEQLTSRIEKNTDLQTTVFSGGVKNQDIEKLEKKVKETATHLKGNKLKDFQNKMRELIKNIDKMKEIIRIPNENKKVKKNLDSYRDQLDSYESSKDDTKN